MYVLYVRSPHQDATRIPFPVTSHYRVILLLKSKKCKVITILQIRTEDIAWKSALTDTSFRILHESRSSVDCQQRRPAHTLI
jgi:hypothetical protein